MKKILITGAKGYIGSFLLKELQFKYEVFGTSLNGKPNTKIIPLDIRDREVVLKYLVFLKPDIIIHAGALSNVKVCEENPLKAFETNVQGTLNIVKGANIINAKVIFISSLASITPSTIYGKNKYDAENIIKAVTAGYEILQLSMTFGLSPNTTNHRPFNKIINTMKTGYPKVYDNNWKFQPTYIKQVIFTIEKLLERDFLGRCLPLVVKESCTMYQIVTDIFPNNNIESANLYSTRREQIITYDTSFEFYFPMYSYSLMIDNIKKELNLAFVSN